MKNCYGCTHLKFGFFCFRKLHSIEDGYAAECHAKGCEAFKGKGNRRVE